FQTHERNRSKTVTNHLAQLFTIMLLTGDAGPHIGANLMLAFLRNISAKQEFIFLNYFRPKKKTPMPKGMGNLF
ncbi:MAG: hypothetical protein IKM00_01745, partial [Clostridia bacterium]|nr:hypothetical protein [Clostridia bacterium]